MVNVNSTGNVQTCATSMIVPMCASPTVAARMLFITAENFIQARRADLPGVQSRP